MWGRDPPPPPPIAYYRKEPLREHVKTKGRHKVSRQHHVDQPRISRRGVSFGVLVGEARLEECREKIQYGNGGNGEYDDEDEIDDGAYFRYELGPLGKF